MKSVSRVQQPDNHNYSQFLQEQLTASYTYNDDPALQNQISEILGQTQDKAYFFCINELNSYFTVIWDHIILSNPDFQSFIQEEMEIRTQNVYSDLRQSRLAIQERPPLLPYEFESDKGNKIHSLKQQSDNLRQKINDINDDLQEGSDEEGNREMKVIYRKLYSEEKIKQAEEFVKKKRQEQLQRKKKLKEQRKREEEILAKKEAEVQEEQQQKIKAKKEQILKKQQENHARRVKQKEEREIKNAEFIKIRKSLNQRTPLFQKLEDGFSKRYEQQERDRMKRMHSERKHYLEHLSRKMMERHEKQYEELKQKRDLERKEKYLKLQQQSKERMKFHSSFQLPAKVPDPKEIQKEQAKEKRQKIKQYRAIVREKFQPRVDDNKRKQLLHLMESMEMGNRRVKKTRLPNGSLVVEDLRSADAKLIGISYLQQSKQMAARSRDRRKHSTDMGKLNPISEEKKYINYIQELRKNRPKVEKAPFVDQKNLSYQQKVKRVMEQSEKLAEANKKNEMMLKYGKFKTSEEILNCKETIDQNYLDMVNMKLKLVIKGKQREHENSGSEQD